MSMKVWWLAFIGGLTVLVLIAVSIARIYSPPRRAPAESALSSEPPAPKETPHIMATLFFGSPDGQALVPMRRDVPLDEIESMIASAHEWVRFVPNTKEETLKHLTPTATSGTLQVPIGRLRKLAMGGEYLSAFTVGDQLLWGAAEPLRRMLRILLASPARVAEPADAVGAKR